MTTLKLRASNARGVVLTEAAAKRLSTVARETFSLTFHEGEQLTSDLPGVDAEAIKHLDEDGLPTIGTEVRPGMILVGRLARPHGKDAAADAIDAAFGAPPGRDGSMRCPPGLFGRVDSIERVPGKGKDVAPSIQVVIATDDPLGVGDVLEFGNGQGEVVSAIVPSLEGVDALWPDRDGEFSVTRVSPTPREVILARSIGPYSLVTQQPLGGRASFGGQPVMLEQLEALLDRGAPHVVHEMLGTKSDDVDGRIALYTSIVKGEPASEPVVSSTTQVLEAELIALGFDVQLTEPEVSIRLLDDAGVLARAPSEVKKPETLNYRTLKPERGGLFCEEIFGALDSPGGRRVKQGRIDLAVPLLHPFARKTAAKLLGLTPEAFESVLQCEKTLDGAEPEALESTGAPALRVALAAVDLTRPPPGSEAEATALLAAGRTAASLCFTRWPVLPPDLRPLVPLDGGRFATSDLNDLYRRVINRNNRTARLIELNAPIIIIRNEVRMLQLALDGLIENDVRGQRITGPDARPLVSMIDMLSGERGHLLKKSYRKRVDYSGIARAAPIEGAVAKFPREFALELLKPWIYASLEEAGHVTRIKEAKRLVEGRDPRALADVARLAAQTPFVLFHEHGVKPIAVTAELWDERAIGLSAEVWHALGLRAGENVTVHVPVDPLAVEEARALTVGKVPAARVPQPEGWLTRCADAKDKGDALFEAALRGEVDGVRDRFARILLARLDA